MYNPEDNFLTSGQSDVEEDDWCICSHCRCVGSLEDIDQMSGFCESCGEEDYLKRVL